MSRKIVGVTVGTPISPETLKKKLVQEIPEKLPSPHALIINGKVYDGSAPVEVNISGDGNSVETVLSDNLFDKSAAVLGKGFYHSSSGTTILDTTETYYGYVELRGAGTYRTKVPVDHHSESYAMRVPLMDANKAWIQNITGTITDTGDRSAWDLEFTVTQEMIDGGAVYYPITVNKHKIDTVMMVKDRDYPTKYIPYGYIEVETGNDVDTAGLLTNVLYGKTAVFLGDSICAGDIEGSEYDGYGWAGLIGEANGMTWMNYGRNGGTIVDNENAQFERWLTTQLFLAQSEYPDTDYVIFEGGTNDAYNLRESGLGVISDDFSTFDTSTFSGAMESLILRILNAFPNAQVGYIVAQKMGNPPYTSANIQRKYFDRAVEICQKWGIPVIDLWNGGFLNPAIPYHAETFYVDGQHLTLAGYQRISPPIEAWMRNMTVPGVVLSSGGSSGGNVDYTALENKPKINGVELTGNKSLEDLGIGQPTNEQIGTAVSAWLDEHPEATTTVQDKSITEEKLSDSVIKRIDGNAIFSGKTASFYGDSLTEANGHYTKGYHSWVKDLLGLASYNNYGVSGYKVSDVYNKVNSVKDTADIVFVMCGVNDQTFSVPLGTMGDTTTGTTYGSLNLLCSLLKQKYPTSIVVFITPPYQTKYPHSEGITSYEVSKAVREVCEKYAIPVYDNFVLSGIYSTNFSTFTTDNCHWNNTAHEMVGKNLAKFVTDSFRYVYGNTSGEGGGDSGEEGETTVSVTGVTLNASSGTLTEGEKVTLVATVLPSNATNKKVTWESNNTSVATVSGGVVTAISEGVATITATTEDGNFTATYALTVEVKEAVGGINVSATIKSAELGKTTHIGFLVEVPVGTNLTARAEFDADDTSKINLNAQLNGPWEYASVDKFNAGNSARTASACKIEANENHVTISKTQTAESPYWAIFVPIIATSDSLPVSIQLSNVMVYIDDVVQPILAVGTYKDNRTGTYADITVM